MSLYHNYTCLLYRVLIFTKKKTFTSSNYNIIIIKKNSLVFKFLLNTQNEKMIKVSESKFRNKIK